MEISTWQAFVLGIADSRSSSYTRHCRILCNIIGQWVEDGEYPNDEKALEKIDLTTQSL